MIITISFNPAIDKTLDVSEYNYAGVNRILHSEIDAGGKGINVAKDLKELGENPMVLGFIAGESGIQFKRMVDKDNIRNDFIPIYGKTRINMKIIESDGKITEFNESGPEVFKDQINELMFKIEGYATENTVFVMSGNVPNGINKDIYKRITEIAHRRGAKVVVGAQGELLSNVIQSKPEMIKIKIKDIEERYDKGEINYLDDEKIVHILSEIMSMGIKYIILSFGEKGAVFASEDKILKCNSLKVKRHSTIGAGDALIAGMLYGIENKMSFEESVKYSMAVSTGSVMTIGTKAPSRKVVKSLIEKIEVKQIG